MKKHTWLVMLIAIVITLSGIWGSMQCISAKDATIKVIPMGTGKPANTTKASTVKTTDKKVATNSNIKIEVVREGAVDTKSTASNASSSKAGSIGGIPYDKLVMANVEEAVNIRDVASENGKIVGKFFAECAGTILEKGKGWTKIKTGDVTGWVINDYLIFGDEARKLAEKVVEKTATCTTDCLRVRKSADPNGTILDLLATGDQIGVLSVKGDWVEVEYADGDIGYVSADYVEIADNLGTGRSIEDINAQIEAEKKEKEAAKAAAKAGAAASTASAGAAAGADAKVAATVASNAAAAGFSDEVLLAALIQAEAGTQPYEGQVAIGNVVMNRLLLGKYGNSIYSVIYAKSQFGPAGSGQVARIAAQGPKAICLQAARAALSGTNYVGTATHFRNINSGYQGIVIGAHVFW